MLRSRSSLSFSLASALVLCASAAFAAEDEAAQPEAGQPPPLDAGPAPAPPGGPPTPPYGAAPMQGPFYGPVPHALPAAPPQADAPKAAEPEPEPEEPEGIVIPRWNVALGARTMFVTSPGYDPFSEDNRLIEFSIGGGRTVYSQGAFSIAAVAFYDGSVRQSVVRGEATELESHRLSLGPEVRGHVLPLLYAFARPSPAVLRTIARLDETTTQTTLHARSWTFGFDAVAGLAFRALSFGRGETATRLWVIGEGGYGWAAANDLSLAVDEDDSASPQRTAPVDLGALALRGPMFRVLVAATF
jgi:hypothetical protein